LLLYRVFPHLTQAQVDYPGHPLYVHPGQGTGRFDNPHLYKAWYLTAEATSAIGESFADIRSWKDAMFTFPQVPGARKALGIYRLPDDLPYVDLDDAQRLVELSVRPSQVVERNRPYTQGLAARIYGMRTYNGVRWWSYHLPQWRVYCLWDIDPEAVEVQALSVSHAAVVDAANSLGKLIVG
jgi:RES domain